MLNSVRILKTIRRLQRRRGVRLDLHEVFKVDLLRERLLDELVQLLLHLLGKSFRFRLLEAFARLLGGKHLKS